MTREEFLKHCGNNSCGRCCFTDACVSWKINNGVGFDKTYNDRKAAFLTNYLRKKKLEKLLS